MVFGCGCIALNLKPKINETWRNNRAFWYTKCMQKIFLWIKSNKLTSVLILAVFLLLFYPSGGEFRSSIDNYSEYKTESLDMVSESAPLGRGGMGFSSNLPIPSPSATPHPEVEKRMKVKNASISLHVKDVKESVTTITKYVEQNRWVCSNSRSKYTARIFYRIYVC